jgi:hypothetical protein
MPDIDWPEILPMRHDYQGVNRRAIDPDSTRIIAEPQREPAPAFPHRPRIARIVQRRCGLPWLAEMVCRIIGMSIGAGLAARLNLRPDRPRGRITCFIGSNGVGMIDSAERLPL